MHQREPQNLPHYALNVIHELTPLDGDDDNGDGDDGNGDGDDVTSFMIVAELSFLLYCSIARPLALKFCSLDHGLMENH